MGRAIVHTSLAIPYGANGMRDTRWKGGCGIGPLFFQGKHTHRPLHSRYMATCVHLSIFSSCCAAFDNVIGLYPFLFQLNIVICPSIVANII